MDLVSVIIPYFKKKKYISETINSVLDQSYKNLEILIIYDDDCFKDLDFLEEIKRKDKRISIIKNHKNLGAGISRNIGISKSKGKYLAFLDADDIWKPNKLDKQITFMRSKNCDATHTSYLIINEFKEVIGKRTARTFSKLNELLKSCDIGTSTMIIKRDLISDKIKFPPLATKEDFVFWLKLLKENVKIHALDEELTLWTKSKSSLSSSTLRKLIDGFKVYNKYMKFNFIKSFYYLICLSINFLLKNK